MFVVCDCIFVVKWMLFCFVVIEDNIFVLVYLVNCYCYCMIWFKIGVISFGIIFKYGNVDSLLRVFEVICKYKFMNYILGL